MFYDKNKILAAAHKLSNLPILAQVDNKKIEIDGLQTVINETQRLRLAKKIRLDWNFHSNCIEGNSLNYGQTTAFIMYGLTAKGKPFKDYVDIKGHNKIVEFIIDLSKDADMGLTQKDLKEFHSIFIGRILRN